MGYVLFMFYVMINMIDPTARRKNTSKYVSQDETVSVRVADSSESDIMMTNNN